MSRFEAPYKEKRNFIRMKVDTPVSIADPQGKAIEGGRCIDLSGGGMLVNVPDTVALDSGLIGTELEVAVTSNHGHSPMLRAKARVNRVETQGSNVGLEILHVMD